MIDRMHRVVPPALLTEAVLQIKARLVNQIAPGLQKIPSAQLTRATVKTGLERTLDSYNEVQGLAMSTRNQIVESALADLVGYGPLEWLLHDPEINEIMVNGAKLVFIERGGELYETDVQFIDNAHVMQIIDRILLHTPLDAKPLYEEAERIESQLKMIHKQSSKQKVKSDVVPNMYG